MAFASMFIVVLLIAAICLFFSFVLGLVLLIIGLVNSSRVKKVWPIILDILGIMIMIPPVVITIVVVIAASKYNYNIEHMMEKYGTVTEAWKNVQVIDEKASNQAFEALFEAADAGDRDAFVANFSQEMREDPAFDDAVDAFFEAYPGGFADAELTYNAHGGRTTGEDWSGAKRGYECVIDGVHYYVTVGFVSHSDEHPEMVGINFFTVMNVEGYAEYTFGDTEINEDNEDIFLLCYVPGSDEVSARRINRYAYLWNESEVPPMTKEEMHDYLAQFTTLQEAIDAGGIGQPNVIPLRDGIDLGEYFYELQPVDGEPRYADIQTSGPFGRIIVAYECTETSADYNDCIVERR